MSITQQAKDFFGAPSVTLRGSMYLWGRSFRRRYDLSDPKQAEKAMRIYKFRTEQYNRWKEAMANFDSDLERWPAPIHYFYEVFMGGNPDHAWRNPCTFIKVIRHRK